MSRHASSELLLALEQMVRLLRPNVPESEVEHFVAQVADDFVPSDLERNTDANRRSYEDASDSPVQLPSAESAVAQEYWGQSSR